MKRLYHHPMSGNSRYIRLILAEYCVDAELEEERQWQRREAFLKMNPAGTLPVLLDEADHPICGAFVIGEFLDEIQGPLMRERRLMPEASLERAEIRRIVDWFLHKFDQEVADYLVHERVFRQQMPADLGGGPPDSAAIRAGRANLKMHMRYVGWLANTRNWLGGNRLSQADLAAAAAISVLDYLGEIDWEAEPAARDWYARIKSRPSFRRLLSDKAAGLPPAAHYTDLDF